MARIPDKPEDVFEKVTTDLKNRFGEDLVSIILYGSGAKGEYIPKKSDINFMVVLSQKGIAELDKAIDVIQEWRKLNIGVPLFLTKNYIATARDTFPIEFLNMKEFHKHVYGEDVLAPIAIEAADLRQQVERELRSKLLHLREGFLSTGHSRDELSAMLAASVTTIASVFAGLLHLKGQDIPRTKTEIFGETAKTFGLNETVFLTVLRIKNQRWHGSRVQLHDVTKAYIAEIKRLVEVVDKM